MLTLVIGGARSGKSRHAQRLCAGRGRVTFVATADPVASSADPEMAERIRRHRADRPAEWTTIEAPLTLVAAVESVPPAETILVDCVTLWISNLLYRDRDLDRASREDRALAAVRELARALGARDSVAVTNEVGGGEVPDSPVAREFRDLQGRANQVLAAAASRVVLVVAGLPLPLKDG